ncbi:MAG TPA: hypothetical protein PLK13_16170 [Xanthobacteraceae bacterium]|uniref:hypothetical protein n=1 Tax=Roseixanthobacter finlandensis TaxID=3119922 RepID=UPI002C528CFC|nr:hypothetical protein [Xanthobacteraceae bacterium]HQS47502.1 hypothetical protein [Xanthobacteraceae bacterium]
MTVETGEARILCPAGIFAAQEAEIRALTGALNRATRLPEKVAFATRLRAVAEDLLACKDRQADNLNCRLCEDFSHLRANASSLLLRAARLVS